MSLIRDCTVYYRSKYFSAFSWKQLAKVWQSARIQSDGHFRTSTTNITNYKTALYFQLVCMFFMNDPLLKMQKINSSPGTMGPTWTQNDYHIIENVWIGFRVSRLRTTEANFAECVCFFFSVMFYLLSLYQRGEYQKRFWQSVSA